MSLNTLHKVHLFTVLIIILFYLLPCPLNLVYSTGSEEAYGGSAVNNCQLYLLAVRSMKLSLSQYRRADPSMSSKHSYRCYTAQTA